MNSREQAAYDTGYDEALNYGMVASCTDFCVYIGDAEDYDFYLSGYSRGQEMISERHKHDVLWRHPCVLCCVDGGEKFYVKGVDRDMAVGHNLHTDTGKPKRLRP